MRFVGRSGQTPHSSSSMWITPPPATQAIVAENARRGPTAFSGSPTDVTTYRVHAYTTSA